MSEMVPMYGFGGGIDNLRFRVYAATSLPASGRENDVCIITSTPIPSWEVSEADNPTWNKNAGFVYLTSVISNWSESPNLLRKNVLYLKLIRCWQYESGKWATKNAYQYRNGAWVQFSTTFRATIHVTYPAGSVCTATDGTTTLTAPDTSGTWDCVVPNAGTWTVSLNSGFSEKVTITNNGDTQTLDKWHLYNRGNECSAVTGGWGAKNFGYYWNTESADNITSITKNSGSMVINSTKGVGVAGTKNKINISKYSKLSVLYSSTGDDVGRALAVLPTRQAVINGGYENTAAKTLLSSGTNVTASVDLTGITDGSYYIAVTVDKQPSCTIYEVYLKT